jgi:hypothetical protein
MASGGIIGNVRDWWKRDSAEARGQAAQADRSDARLKARVTDSARTAYSSARAFVRGATKRSKKRPSGR